MDYSHIQNNEEFHSSQVGKSRRQNCMHNKVRFIWFEIHTFRHTWYGLNAPGKGSWLDHEQATVSPGFNPRFRKSWAGPYQCGEMMAAESWALVIVLTSPQGLEEKRKTEHRERITRSGQNKKKNENWRGSFSRPRPKWCFFSRIVHHSFMAAEQPLASW